MGACIDILYITLKLCRNESCSRVGNVDYINMHVYFSCKSKRITCCCRMPSFSWIESTCNKCLYKYHSTQQSPSAGLQAVDRNFLLKQTTVKVTLFYKSFFKCLAWRFFLSLKVIATSTVCFGADNRDISHCPDLLGVYTAAFPSTLMCVYPSPSSARS